MKKRVLLSCLLLSALALFVTVGCGKENTDHINDKTHIHDYTENYKYDSTNHWCECECGEKTNEEEHTYGEWMLEKKATHIEVGSMIKVCSVCGYEYREEIQPLGHTYSEGWSNDKTHHWCECECGEKTNEEEHTYGEWMLEKKATHTEAGSRIKVCSVCSYGYSEEIQPLGHTYSETWNYNELMHWHECSCGEKSNIAEHNFESGVCIGCGFYESSGFISYELLENDTYKASSYNGSFTEVVIPNYYNGKRVSCIGDTFTHNTSITSVVISGNIEDIPCDVFGGCISLKNVKILEGVKYISNFAFVDCVNLEKLEIPDSVEYIGDCAFSRCINLKSIKIPNGVVELGNNAFSGCSSLTSVEIPNSVTTISNFLFSECSSLTSVKISNNITSIGSSAFNECTNLKSIDIPNSVTDIGDFIFSGCSSLTSVKIPNTVTNIGSGLFIDCISLTSVEIPNNLTSIGSSMFKGCSSLSSIEIPEGVTSIGKYAFSGCSSLASIEIPTGVTSIGNDAFYECSSLISIVISSGIEKIDLFAFYECNNLKIVYYKGTALDWRNMIIEAANDNLENASIYYYNEFKPTESGNYWHYVDGEVVVWE